MVDVTDAAAGALRTRPRHHPALPGRVVKVVADEAGTPGVGDVELRPGLLAERRAAERAGGAVLDWDAAAGRLVGGATGREPRAKRGRYPCGGE